MTLPDYWGGSIANLSAELESRLTGSTPGIPLHDDIAGLIPAAGTYIVILFDGLGDHQLDHPAASTLRSSRAGSIDSVFPTTTSVNLSSLVTGLPPSQHGLIAHLALLDGAVVNTLKWTAGGTPVSFDTTRVLPAPNLWERLSAASIEPVTVQPGAFLSSPLTKALYRGCRVEPVWNVQELIEATVQLAAHPGRLVFTYVPDVDFAAHVHGTDSVPYAEALQLVDTLWSAISASLPPRSVMVGTADHGVLTYPSDTKITLPRPAELTYFGDPRGVAVKGPAGVAARLARSVPARWVPVVEMADWWGPEPQHPLLEHRLPDGMLFPDPGHVLLPSGMDSRLSGYHGGLDAREVKIPLLVETPAAIR